MWPKFWPFISAIQQRSRFGIEVGEELVDNFRDQGFEGLVPSELLRVADALAMDDPPHIADPVRAQDERQLVTRRPW